MDFLELVKKRRSVRKYISKPVPKEIIEYCLEAARLAPSACNSQPWYFILVDDDKIKNELADKVFSGIHTMNNFAKQAPVLAVVVSKGSNYTAKVGGFFKGIQYNLLDIGIACEHFVLAATEKGVGTCYLGWFDEKQVKKVLKISKEDKIDLIISMGYEENQEPREKIRKTIDETRKYNV